MVRKCVKCGEPIAKIPIFTYSEGKKVLLWKNLFMLSLDSIVLIIIIALMVITYKHDTKVCMEIIKHPLEFCIGSNACKVIEQQQFNIQPTKPIPNPFNLNITKENGGVIP